MQWLPEIGVGFLDIDPEPDLYGADYFCRYVALDSTPMSERLNAARVDLVTRHWLGYVVDIGVGGGSFMRAHGRAAGWDVNPEAVKMLHRENRFVDPRNGVDCVTLWDSLEHMRNPSEILRQVRSWVFVSTPIYSDAHDCLMSKHFKPGEHLWYFTEPGLVAYMARLGFSLREASRVESDLGREGVGSFAFQRGA